MSSPARSRAFTTTLEALPKGKARVPVPFDPNEVWGTKHRGRRRLLLAQL